MRHFLLVSLLTCVSVASASQDVLRPAIVGTVYPSSFTTERFSCGYGNRVGNGHGVVEFDLRELRVDQIGPATLTIKFDRFRTDNSHDMAFVPFVLRYDEGDGDVTRGDEVNWYGSQFPWLPGFLFFEPRVSDRKVEFDVTEWVRLARDNGWAYISFRLPIFGQVVWGDWANADIGNGYGNGDIYDNFALRVYGPLRGDLNCDGEINSFDIEPFMLALFDPEAYVAEYPDCNLLLGDVNEDCNVDAFDIEPFLGLLFP